MLSLRYAIHFYDDPTFLFQTVTMVEGDEREATLDALAHARGWFWGRWKRTDREEYMARRVAVERMLHETFQLEYGALPSDKPVYLYLIPGVGPSGPDDATLAARGLDRHRTHCLVVDLDALAERCQLSFTVGDSCRSYRARLVEMGIPCRPLQSPRPDLPDEERVFPLDALDEVYARNQDVAGLTFELQVWDRSILLDYMREREPALWALMDKQPERGA